VSITLLGSHSIPLIRAISARTRSELLGCPCSNPLDRQPKLFSQSVAQQLLRPERSERRSHRKALAAPADVEDSKKIQFSEFAL
jgi:hypothetical protein